LTVVFVMAQGQQQRIGHMLGVNGLPAWKQLLKASETETILSRACRLFLEDGVDTVIAVIHWHHELVNACMDKTLPFIVQRDPGPSVLSGIYNMRHLWGSRTIIALGDVVYSRETVRRMVSDRSFKIYERSGRNETTGNPYPERFGISFGREHHAELLSVLERPDFRSHGDSKLIDLKEPLGGHMTVESISDYTDDVDTEEGFREWFPILREAAARDI